MLASHTRTHIQRSQCLPSFTPTSLAQVFKVMAPNRKIFALKRIRLTGRDSEAAAGFMDEITLLKSLRGRSNIIQLIDAEVGFEGVCSI